MEKSLAPGATYIEIHRNTADSQPLAVFILKLDRSAKNVSFRAMKGQDHVIGTETPRTMGESLGDKNGEVLATINADFFDMDKPYAGLPCGMIVRDGELLCSPTDWPVLGFGTDGQPRAAVVKLVGSVNAGDQTFPVSEVNRPQGGDNVLAVFTSGFGPSTLNSKRGTDVVIQDIVPNLPLKPGIQYSGRVAEVKKGVADDKIPANAVLLYGAGSGASFLEKNTAVGSTISFSLGLGAEWNQVTQALGGWPVIIRGGQPQTIAPDDISAPRHPRSAVGWNERYLYVVAVDGRDALESAGMTMSELTGFMQELGCTEALNLDGGGSTTLAIRGNMVNHGSDGLDRSVSSGWAVMNAAPSGVVKSLHVWPENISILEGSHAQFRVMGADADGSPVQLNPADVKWSLRGVDTSLSSTDPDNDDGPSSSLKTKNKLGSVNASGMFVAAPVFRSGEITAKVGDVSAAAVVNVWDKPAALFIVPTNNVHKPGQSVRYSVLASDRAGRPMVLDASAVTWKADGAKITSDGKLSVPASGKFKVTAIVARVHTEVESEVRDR
jgi:hypothetical protein